MPSRRELLRIAGATGVAGVAGCTAESNPADDESGSLGTAARPSDTERPPEATHRVGVAGTDADPEIPVRPRISIIDPYATPESPPVVRVDVDNPTYRTVVAGEYRSVVFQYSRSESDAFYLLPHSERSTDGEPDREPPGYETDGDCWKIADHPVVTLEYGTVAIPPGGTLTAFVGLYAGPDGTDCYPNGIHRFEEGYTHFRNSPVAGDDNESERWGFSLSVESL